MSNTYANQFEIYRGVKFLKKLWCCVGERVEKGNLILLAEFIT